MIPLPPESVRAVAAGDEVEVFVPLGAQPDAVFGGQPVVKIKITIEDPKQPGYLIEVDKHPKTGKQLYQHPPHPLGEPGTVHGVGEEWRKMTPLRDGDLQAVYFPDGEITYNPAFDDHRVHTAVPIINQHADTLPYWAVRHRVQTTRLGPVEQRDGVWGGVGIVKAVTP
jgi:hypothetical protein